MAELSLIYKRVNPARLDEEMRAAFGGRIQGISTGPHSIRVHFQEEPSGEDEALAQAVLDAHDPEALSAAQQACQDFLMAWHNGVLVGKTPAQIYQIMTGQIDKWASLAEAKADLRAWLPLMGMALGYLLRGELD